MVPVRSRRPHAYPAFVAWLGCLAAPVVAQMPSAAAAQPLPAAALPPAPGALPPADALDPASPMAPLPDLGVAWPDLALPDSAAAPVGAGSAPPGAAPVRPAAPADVTSNQRYHVAIIGIETVDGIDPAALRLRFNALSALRADEGDPANTAQIDRRAHEDEDVLRGLLRASGFYDARVGAGIDADPVTHRITVTLSTESGPLYRFASVALPGLAATGTHAASLGAAFPVKTGDPVDAEKVQAAQAALRTALGREGFAFAKVGDPDVTIDHETRTAALALAVNAGPPQRFGEIRVVGTALFGARHLQRIARFRPGQPYDAALLEDYRRALIQTGLVSTVKVTPEPTGTPGVVDIATRLEAAPPRTVAGELGYGTGEGARLALSWTHRNLIHPEGAVTFQGVAGTREQLLGASLRRSNYKGRDRVLTAQIVAAHTQRDAYDARTFTLAAGLERQTNIIWQKKWTWSVGGELVASDERDTIRATGQPRRRTFFIAALPGTLAYDGSDDLLNPTRGYRLSGRLSPELSLQDGTFGYARAQIDASVYQPFGDRFVLAGRTRFGSIFGATRDRIAPSRRFYAGGGGSVRGFGYQDIGPKDLNNDPVGGRSLAEFSIEGRVRFGDFGVVPFLDAGNLYTSVVPSLTGLRFGSGIGARYYTSFGPIRLDVGTPIDRRKGEARVAVYVSLGQAF